MKRLVCLAAPMAAPAQDPAANPISATLRMYLDRYSKNLVATAEEMRAEKYDYRPTPDEMTFGRTIAHIAEVNNDACGKILDTPAASDVKTNDADSKEKLIEGLKASMDYCAQVFSKLTDAKLAETVPGPGGRSTTRLRFVMEVTNDLVDHYAGLSVYIRLNGLLPPTAQRKK